MLLGIALLSTAGPFGTDMYLPSLPEISDEFGVTDSVTQLTITGFMVGMALGQLVAHRESLMGGLFEFAQHGVHAVKQASGVSQTTRVRVQKQGAERLKFFVTRMNVQRGTDQAACPR